MWLSFHTQANGSIIWRLVDKFVFAGKQKDITFIIPTKDYRGYFSVRFYHCKCMPFVGGVLVVHAHNLEVIWVNIVNRLSTIWRQSFDSTMRDRRQVIDQNPSADTRSTYLLFKSDAHNNNIRLRFMVELPSHFKFQTRGPTEHRGLSTDSPGRRAVWWLWSIQRLQAARPQPGVRAK